MRGISWLAEELLASQDGFSSLELVITESNSGKKKVGFVISPQCQIYSSKWEWNQNTNRTEKLKLPLFAKRRYAGGNGGTAPLTLNISTRCRADDLESRKIFRLSRIELRIVRSISLTITTTALSQNTTHVKYAFRILFFTQDMFKRTWVNI